MIGEEREWLAAERIRNAIVYDRRMPDAASTTGSELIGDRRTLPVWLLVLACLVAALPPLLVHLGERDVSHGMERLTLISSQETWLRQHAGEERAWLIPTDYGEPRLIKPPLVVWLNLLSWIDLKPESTHPETLVLRARSVSVIMAVLVLLGIFWIGRTLGDATCALLAVLVASAMFFLQREGRFSAYDIHLTAWATLSIAAALSAITSASRRSSIMLWLLAGFFLGLGWMTKGPIAILVTAVPIAGGLALLSQRRILDSIMLLASITIAASMVGPWFLYAFSTVPNAVEIWKEEYEAQKSDPAAFWYYIAILALVFPWTIWFIGGLLHPFMHAHDHSQARRRSLVPWIWLVGVVLILSFAEAKQQRYLLPLVPAAALLIARVLRDHAQSADVRIKDGLLRIPHWITLAAASIGIAFIVIVPDALFSEAMKDRMMRFSVHLDEWPTVPPVDGIGPAAAIFLSIALLVITIVGWQRHRNGRAAHAGVATALWAIIVTTAYWYGSAGANAEAAAPRIDGLRIRDEIRAGSDVRNLVINDVRDRDQRLGSEFRFYASSMIPEVTLQELERGNQSDDDAHGDLLVIAADTPAHAAALEALGFTRIGPIQATWKTAFVLWERE